MHTQSFTHEINTGTISSLQLFDSRYVVSTTISTLLQTPRLIICTVLCIHLNDKQKKKKNQSLFLYSLAARKTQKCSVTWMYIRIHTWPRRQLKILNYIKDKQNTQQSIQVGKEKH